MARAKSIDTKHVFLSLMPAFPWAGAYYRELRVFPDRLKAFETLIEKGCNPKSLMMGLFLSAGGLLTDAAARVREQAEMARDFAHLTLKHVRRMERFAAFPQNRRRFKTLGRPEFRALSQSLASYANALLDELQQSTITPSRDVPGTAIVFLAVYVEDQTGGPHFAEIAQLMAAFFSMRGIDKSVTTRAIEKQVKRARNKDPLFYTFGGFLLGSTRFGQNKMR